ncbi:MAG: LUD domain-containing protein [Halobacteriales archaeon]
MTETQDDVYEMFAAKAAEYDVELARVPAAEATGAIADAVEAPAVGAPLPWEEVAMPEGVTTDPTPADLDRAVTGVTAASVAVADYGSIVLEPSPDGGEPASLFADRHVAVLREADILPDMEAAFEWLGETVRETRGSAIVATGPSATADMGALVKGAHGPKDVEIVVVT